MVDDHGIGDEHARWAVDTRALVLGVSKAPVTGLRPSAPVHPPVPERVPDPAPERGRLDYSRQGLGVVSHDIVYRGWGERDEGLARYGAG